MRKHYLDNIRWITVSLVVIYHVIYIFNGVTTFGVIGPFREVQYQDCIQYLLYPWFMVLLFVVAGMSSRFYLDKHSDGEFVRSRTRKLLVPGTVGVLVFGWIQGYCNMSISNAFAGLSGQPIPKPVIFIIMSLSGIGVLWFVQMLWLFSLLLVVIRRIENDRLYNVSGKSGIIVLLLLGIIIYLSSKILNTPVVTVYRFGIYGTAYLIGYFVLSHDEVMEHLSQFWHILSICAVALGISYTVIYFGENYAIEPYVNNVLACAYGWIMTLAVLAFGKKFLDYENAFTKQMNRWNWGLYVFHYLPLSATALCLHKYVPSMPAVLVYILTCIAAFGGGIALYEIVSRIPVLRWCVLGIKAAKNADNIPKESHTNEEDIIKEENV